MNMNKRFVAVFLLCALLTVVSVGCGQTAETPFPPESAFSAEVRVTGAVLTEDGDYRVGIEAILHNNTQQEYVLNGNPTCWNVLYVNGQEESQDVPLGTYTLAPGGKLTEQKEIRLAAETVIGSELYIVSQFYITHEDGTQQTYTIQSDVVTVTQEQLNAVPV